MSGAEDFRLEEAFVVIDGRATYTADTTFKVAAAINETKFLDEDSTDQMEHLAKFTNGTVLAVNQHAVLLLHNLQRCAKMEKSIQQLQGAVEKCLPLIERVTTAEDEHRIVTAQIASQRNTINALEEELKRELVLRDERERDNIKRRDEMIQNEILQRERDRTDRERIEAMLTSRLDTVENRMGAVEKDTLWKISDCQDLLKIRPTQEVVVNLIDDLERRLTDLNLTNKRPSDSQKTGDPSPDIVQIREDLLSMEMKISKLENKLDSTKGGKFDGAGSKTLASLSEKMDNYHLKFEDIQTNISTTQQRVESLNEQLKQLKSTLEKITFIDETINSKFAIISESLVLMREEVQRVWQSSSTSVDQNEGFNGGHGGGNPPGSGNSPRLPTKARLKTVGDPIRLLNPQTGLEEPFSNLSSGKAILEEPIPPTVHLTTPLSNLHVAERNASLSPKDEGTPVIKSKSNSNSGMFPKKKLLEQPEPKEVQADSPRDGGGLQSGSQKIQPTLVPYEVPQAVATAKATPTVGAAAKEEKLHDPQNALKPPAPKRRESQFTGGVEQVQALGMSTAGFLPPSAGMTRAEKERFEELRSMVESVKQTAPIFTAEMGEFKNMLGALNQKVAIMQSDLNFKVDKDNLQQDLDEKLDKAEYINRLSEGANLYDTVQKLEYDIKSLSKKNKELDDNTNKIYKKLKGSVQEVTDSQKIEVERLEGLIKIVSEEFKKKPSVDDYRLKSGTSIQKEFEKVSALISEMQHLLTRIRGDQISALASNTLCLSCGRGDVNFMPPMEHIKGINGVYYKAEASRKHGVDPATYDIGIDVYTKDEAVHEHQFHAHLPVDTILQAEGSSVEERDSSFAGSSNKKKAQSSSVNPAFRRTMLNKGVGSTKWPSNRAYREGENGSKLRSNLGSSMHNSVVRLGSVEQLPSQAPVLLGKSMDTSKVARLMRTTKQTLPSLNTSINNSK